jgi:hypothetical protein
MKHWRLIAVFALVAVSGAASHATAQYKAELKNSLVVGPTGPWGEAAVKFADLLKERTQGRINVRNYFDGQPAPVEAHRGQGRHPARLGGERLPRPDEQQARRAHAPGS